MITYTGYDSHGDFYQVRGKGKKLELYWRNDLAEWVHIPTAEICLTPDNLGVYIVDEDNEFTLDYDGLAELESFNI